MVCDEPKSKHTTWATCNVCYELIKQEDFFVLEQCGHEFCKECMTQQLKTLVETCTVSKLKCLDYECRELLTDEQSRAVLDDATYKILKRYQEALDIERDKDKIRCPNTECEKVLNLKEIKKSSKGKKGLFCPHCEKEICKKCNLLAHPGKKCADSNEGKFRIWASMSSGVKNCPVC